MVSSGLLFRGGRRCLRIQEQMRPLHFDGRRYATRAPVVHPLGATRLFKSQQLRNTSGPAQLGYALSVLFKNLIHGAITHHVKCLCQRSVKHKVFSGCETFVMSTHPSAQRLFEAAEASKGLTRAAEIARVLNVSAQVIENWESRGVSKSGAIAAEAAFNVSPTWILTGNGAMAANWPTATEAQGPACAKEPAAPWHADRKTGAADLAQWLADTLDSLPPGAQREAQEALGKLAGAPDSTKARAALIRALEATQ